MSSDLSYQDFERLMLRDEPQVDGQCVTRQEIDKAWALWCKEQPQSQRKADKR